MDRRAWFPSLPVGLCFLTGQGWQRQVQPLPGVPVVGMGPAWALATEVGTLGQRSRGEAALPSLFAFPLLVSGGRVPARPLCRGAVLRGGSRAWMWSAHTGLC